MVTACGKWTEMMMNSQHVYNLTQSSYVKVESSNCLKMQAFKPTHTAGRQKKISPIDLKSTGPILRYLAFLTLLDSHFIAIDFIAKTSNCKED